MGEHPTIRPNASSLPFLHFGEVQVRHPIVEAALSDRSLRKELMDDLVEAHFHDVITFDLPDETDAKTAYADLVVDCAVESAEAIDAFVEIYDRGGYATGAVYDAFERMYREFDDLLAAAVAVRASEAGWNGPIDAPCIVHATFGEGEGYPYLAIRVPGLVSYGFAVVAAITNGSPERTATGAIDWIEMPWHRISAIDDFDFPFDPEVRSAEAYAAGWLHDRNKRLVELEIARMDAAERDLSRSSAPGIGKSIDEASNIVEFFDALLDEEGSREIGTAAAQVLDGIGVGLGRLKALLREDATGDVKGAISDLRAQLNALEAVVRPHASCPNQKPVDER